MAQCKKYNPNISLKKGPVLIKAIGIAGPSGDPSIEGLATTIAYYTDDSGTLHHVPCACEFK